MDRHPLIVVVAALVVLSGATVLLRSFHDHERVERTASHLERGRVYAARNDLESAVTEYRAALSVEPDDPIAGRALALALLSLGRLSEAESYLRDLQRDDPTDGAMNRALARIYAARGRAADARIAYQRAIYGDWPADEVEERLETRFELIDYLKRLRAPEEVLAELLRLKAELPPQRTSDVRRVAQLLADAGVADQAVEMLRAGAATAPRDLELLAHLADIQAAAGRTVDARTTLRQAVAIDPQRIDLAERLAVADRVLALDPTLPRLRLVTRTRRARLVLAAVLAQIRACGTDAAEASQGLFDDAAKRLRQPARANAEMAELEMDLAARLWSAFPACHGSSTEARAIGQVLQRIQAASELQS